jgi:hypothetical protein
LGFKGYSLAWRSAPANAILWTFGGAATGLLITAPEALREYVADRSSAEVSSPEPVEGTPLCVCYGKHENAVRADLERKRIRESV